MEDRIFHIAREEEIVKGEVTDVYFIRTVEVLKAAGLDNVRVRAEFHVASLPRGYRWAVYAGLREVLNLVLRAGLRVSVYSLPEGTIFFEDEPLLVIEGRYVDFAVYETPILGILRHYTSVATKAARIRKAAGDRTVLFFGARAVHPAIQPMVDRAAYIGGCDAVANVLGARLLGKEPVGTMPHALMIIFRQAVGDHTLAWAWFDRALPDAVPRIVLVDTFYDEREETYLAVRLLKEKLRGVRLDTPGSRRGNMRKIVKEVKWLLKLINREDVKIVVSGGLDEESIRELRELVDVFGVGTTIAFPPSVDISMDIVEIYDDASGTWVPITKRGKLPGFKQVYRCIEEMKDEVVPYHDKPTMRCRDGREPVPLLEKYVEDGKLVRDLPSDDDVRRYVLEQLKNVDL
ncbi:MAG: nicotinate phosphoribosyltransferase [Crenarchaeota archaeon]|nr:nicotinate phosphoribosyltransferase [Thermoproteota archaeon]